MANEKRLPRNNRCFNGQEGHSQRTKRQGPFWTQGCQERQDRTCPTEGRLEEREKETNREETR